MTRKGRLERCRGILAEVETESISPGQFLLKVRTVSAEQI